MNIHRIIDALIIIVIIEMSARGSYRDKTLRELEEELRNLKEKEKYFLKLSQRVKELEEKSRRMKRATDDLAP